MKKKSANKNLTSLVDHLDKEYGKRGTKKREKFEEGFEDFKLGVMANKENEYNGNVSLQMNVKDMKVTNNE